MRKVLTGLFILISLTTAAQDKPDKSFPERCIGSWEGTLQIFKNGFYIDSVDVRFTVAEKKEENVYQWKTEYFSEEQPAVKDFTLRLVDEIHDIYIIDEGAGVELKGYVIGNKLYSIFQVKSNLLTSTYELSGENLIFEATSGGMLDETAGVTNYTVNVVQRSIYSKVK